VPARWHKEVLTAGGGEEALEPLVVLRHAVPLGQVDGRLVRAHFGEEAGGGHEHREVQLGPRGAAAHVEIVEAGTPSGLKG
jgi:hypothetical protein